VILAVWERGRRAERFLQRSRRIRASQNSAITCLRKRTNQPLTTKSRHRVEFGDGFRPKSDFNSRTLGPDAAANRMASILVAEPNSILHRRKRSFHIRMDSRTRNRRGSHMRRPNRDPDQSQVPRRRSRRPGIRHPEIRRHGNLHHGSLRHPRESRHRLRDRLRHGPRLSSVRPSRLLQPPIRQSSSF
jgi:hypothetical protein